jgi:hypothetical protein
MACGFFDGRQPMDPGKLRTFAPKVAQKKAIEC